jgi:hypothetical protein
MGDAPLSWPKTQSGYTIPRPRPPPIPFTYQINLGSINFSIHIIGHRYRPEDYRFDWEQPYVEYTKKDP